MRVLIEHGASGQIYSMKVRYDSGCSSMALDANILAVLVAPAALASFPTTVSSTAAGRIRAPRVQMEVRILSRDKTSILVPWTLIHCSALQNRRSVIFRGNLESDCFVCNQPRLQRLYVSRTKAQLVTRMPRQLILHCRFHLICYIIWEMKRRQFWDLNAVVWLAISERFSVIAVGSR